MASAGDRQFIIEEELALALFFCNVEKFRWVTRAKCFTPSMLTEPKKIGYKTFAPYIFTALYKKILRYEAESDLRARNNEIAAIIESEYGISLDIPVSFEWGSVRSVFSTSPYMRKHALSSELNYDLYDAIGSFDLTAAKEILSKGGDPLARMHEDKPESMYEEYVSKIHYGSDHYDTGSETWDHMQFMIVNILPNVAMKEQMLAMLDEYVPVNIQKIVRSRTGNNKPRPQSFQEEENVLGEDVKKFLDSIDAPESILAIMDDENDYYDEYTSVLDYVMTSLKYLSIRVGGSSFRSGDALTSYMLKKDYPRGRFVSLKCNHDFECNGVEESNVRYVDMTKLNFKEDPALIEYADRFDIRAQDANGEMKSKVWFYVNNIPCGWFKDDGTWMNFDFNVKGLWMLTEVANIKGFKNLPPATAAMLGNYELAKYGPWKPKPGYSQERPATLAERQEQLCKDAGIPYFDIATTIKD